MTHDIRHSGARDLDELLDIYIPNFQRMNEYYEFRKNGLRGINSDRDDKYLILVNGKKCDKSYDRLWDPVFSPDCSHVLLRYVEDDKYCRQVTPSGELLG